MSGLEDLNFFTENSLVDNPYDYYDAIRRCLRREPVHGVASRNCTSSSLRFSEPFQCEPVGRFLTAMH